MRPYGQKMWTLVTQNAWLIMLKRWLFPVQKRRKIIHVRMGPLKVFILPLRCQVRLLNFLFGLLKHLKLRCSVERWPCRNSWQGRKNLSIFIWCIVQVLCHSCKRPEQTMLVSRTRYVGLQRVGFVQLMILSWAWFRPCLVPIGK